MKQLIIILTLATGLFSCGNTANTADMQVLDFGYFTLEAPQNWKKIKESGIDSYVGRIAIDQKDTLNFDLGWYSNKLEEYYEVKSDDGKTYYISNDDTTDRPTVVDSANLNQILKSQITWETIDGKRAKILSPIKPGTGITGIYIDSLWKSGSAIDRFNLYGMNLQPHNEKPVLAAFKTLKFYKKGKR